MCGGRACAADERTSWESQPADVVLIDLHLPDVLPGAMVIEAQAWRPVCAIVAITSDPDPVTGNLAVANGADAFLAKRDLNPDRLFSAIRQALARRDRERQQDAEQQLLLDRIDDLDAYVASISHDLRSPLTRPSRC